MYLPRFNSGILLWVLLLTAVLITVVLELETNIPANMIVRTRLSDWKIMETVSKDWNSYSSRSKPTQQETYTIVWYNPPPYIKVRKKAYYTTSFDKCRFKNCRLTYNKQEGNTSHAIIFDGRFFKAPPFSRPGGQVWIFAAHEAPSTFRHVGGDWHKKPWKGQFNWTMTYDIHNTNIYLPYGELRKRSGIQSRDFDAIASNKSKNCIIIVSHCPTQSRREKYLDELKKYIDVDVFGKCGKPFKCGARFKHDSCFDILNTTYRYYLAFENAYCRQYFTEKLFENYNYDILTVSLGGDTGEASNVFPNGTIISTDSFLSPAALANYLKELSASKERYADMLRTKSQYESVDYSVVYQRALCEVCERMNNQHKYHNTIEDLTTWATPPCRKGQEKFDR